MGVQHKGELYPSLVDVKDMKMCCLVLSPLTIQSSTNISKPGT